MRYRLRTLLICSIVGAVSGGSTLLCYGFKEHLLGFPIGPLGYAILAAYGGLIGFAVGFTTRWLARWRTDDPFYFPVLYAVIVMASIGAAITCLPFTAPQQLLELMSR